MAAESNRQRGLDREQAAKDKKAAIEAIAKTQEKLDQDKFKRATIPRVAVVECTHKDIWQTGKCANCHGMRHDGINVFDWENAYDFTIRTEQTAPVTITAATVEIYRVKFLQKPYTLCPSENAKYVSYYAPVTKDERCEPPTSVPFQPELGSHTFFLSKMTDEKSTLPTVSLGRIDVVGTRTIPLQLAES